MTDPRRVRRDQVAALARERGLDGVLAVSWHRQAVAWLTGYAPGYVSNRAALWIGADGSCRLGVRFPFDLARAAASGLPVVAAAQPHDLVPAGARRIGLAAGDLAVDEATGALPTALLAAGVRGTDLRAELDDLQETKLPAEVEALRHAGDVAALALDAWGGQAPHGATDYEIAARIEAVARAGGARRAVCLVGIGPGAVVTEATGRVVGDADEVGLELTIYVDEWCMHVNRQLVTAGADGSAVVRGLCARVRHELLRAMTVDMPVDDLVALGDELLAAAGLLAAKEYDFGHGLAADTPVSPQLVAGTGRRLADRSVMALHVAVRVPDGPTGFVGGPVLLTTDGARELNPDSPWARETARHAEQHA